MSFLKLKRPLIAGIVFETSKLDNSFISTYTATKIIVNALSGDEAFATNVATGVADMHPQYIGTTFDDDGDVVFAASDDFSAFGDEFGFGYAVSPVHWFERETYDLDLEIALILDEHGFYGVYGVDEIPFVPTDDDVVPYVRKDAVAQGQTRVFNSEALVLAIKRVSGNGKVQVSLCEGHSGTGLYVSNPHHPEMKTVFVKPI